MNNIFISYRRADSADVVGRIYEHLAGIVGRDSIFRDVQSVDLGVDFLKSISEAIEGCDVQLAIIGHEWMAGRRIDDPNDLVRLEIETALKRDIPVIPVLVGGADMPALDELPDTLKPIVYRNAMKVRPDPDFQTDMARLEAALEKIITLESNTTIRLRRWLPWAAGLLLAAAGLAYFAFPIGPQETRPKTDSAIEPPGNAQGDLSRSAPDPEKAGRAMQFVDQYNGTDPLVNARARVSEATSNGMGAIASVLNNPDLSEEELAAAYSDTILSLVEEENLGASLEQLFKFYEQMLICREMQLCDEQVVARFFDNDAGGFSRTFYPWVCKVRAEWNNPAAFEQVLDFYIEGNSATVCG